MRARVWVCHQWEVSSASKLHQTPVARDHPSTVAHVRSASSSWSGANQSMGTSIAGLEPINQRAHQPINGHGIDGWCTHPQVCPLAGRR